MKKFIFTLSFIFIILFSTNYSYSQSEKTDKINETAFIGYADIESIYSFHPMMKYFDENHNLFIRPVNAKDKNEFLKIVNDKTKEFTSAKEANSSEIKRLKSEIDNLSAIIQKNIQRKNTETALLNDSYNRDILNVKDENERKQLTQKLYKDTAAIEEKLNKENITNETKLNELKKEYSKIQFKLLNIFYFPPEETEKVFIRINNEIKEALNYSANKRGVKAVINSSNVKKSKEPAAVGLNNLNLITAGFNYEKLEDIISKIPDYSKALTMFDISAENATTKGAGPEISDPGLKGQYQEKMAEITKDSYIRNHESNYLKKAAVADAARKYMINDTILIGGADLTATSIIYLLSRYNVPRAVAENINELINKNK